VISKCLHSVKGGLFLGECTAYQDSVSDYAQPPRTKTLGDCEGRSEHASNRIFQVEIVQTLLVGARKTQGWRGPSLDHSNCSKHIVLCVPEILCVLTGARVDGITTFVVQLDIVVPIEVLVSLREIYLGRSKLDELIGLRDVVCRLER
jgi:hypothetical protein